jgi:hypothetical protein
MVILHSSKSSHKAGKIILKVKPFKKLLSRLNQRSQLTAPIYVDSIEFKTCLSCSACLPMISTGRHQFPTPPRRASLPRRGSSQERKTRIIRVKNNNRDRVIDRRALRCPSRANPLPPRSRLHVRISVADISDLLDQINHPFELVLYLNDTLSAAIITVAVGSANRDRIPSHQLVPPLAAFFATASFSEAWFFSSLF